MLAGYETEVVLVNSRVLEPYNLRQRQGWVWRWGEMASRFRTSVAYSVFARSLAMPDYFRTTPVLLGRGRLLHDFACQASYRRNVSRRQILLSRSSSPCLPTFNSPLTMPLFYSTYKDVWGVEVDYKGFQKKLQETL